MEIKKVLNLSQEEFDALVKAGEIVGGIKKALEDNDADEISDGAKKLIAAVQTVTAEVLNK